LETIVTRDLIVWWLTAQAFGLAGLPLTRFLFRALPDRGYAFGKALGLLLSGYLAWLLAMLGLGPFGRGLLVICALAVGGIGIFITREPRTKGQEPENRRTAEPENQEPKNRRTLDADERGRTRTTEQEPQNQEPQNRRTEESENQEPAVTHQASSIKHQASSIKDGTFSIFNLQFAIPTDWRLLLCYELLFTLALIFVALLRSYNPDPWGTERPMDYALFNAIRSSSAFPPHDPWMAGYSINYYYFGYLLMAAISLVSGIDQGAAFNLSLALIFALTALGAAGVVVNLIGLTTKEQEGEKGRRGEGEKGGRNEAPSPPHPLTPSPPHRWLGVGGRIGAVLLSVILVLFAGNQGGALEIITGLTSPLAMDGRDLARAVQNGLGKREPLYLQHPYKEWGAPDITTVLTPTDMAANFNWWNPSRAVWDTSRDPGDPTKFYAITEFPFFSFWLGDMHPHVMALPFGLLALGLALQTIARPTAPTFVLGRRGWAELALTGIVLGSLYTINSWDFPTYVLLFLGALLLLYVRLGMSQRLEIRDWRLGDKPLISNLQSPISSLWWRHFASQTILALLAAWLLFTPFYLTFHSLVGGKEPLIQLPILATLTRTIGFVTWTKTPLHSFVIIFGLALAPLVAFTIAQSRQVDQPLDMLPAAPAPDEAGEPTAEPVAAGWHEEQRLGFAARLAAPGAWRYLPLALLAVLLLGIALGFPLLVLLALAIYAARLAIARAAQPAEAFVLMAFALVCLICFGTELVYIRDVFEMRMNTIFKFYYQAWLIWSVLAGYALWWLFAGKTKDEGQKTKVARISVWSFVVRRSSFVVFAVLFLGLLAGALIYPWYTAGKTFRTDQRIGLDGKTPPEHTPEGAAAIAWLRANAPGDAVILEAVGDDYNVNGGNAVSASTGLATVLGWAGHEQQWRGGDPPSYAQIDVRRADIATIYNAGDLEQARALLKKYGVDYIYVGTAEQATYGQLDLNKLSQLGEQVFQQGNVTIYQVGSRQ
jgi:YYY domain-containing protein